MLIYIGNIAFLKKNWTSTEIAYDTEIARRYPTHYHFSYDIRPNSGKYEIIDF